MPFGAGVDYPLMLHVNEVTRACLDLARRAAADWDMQLDPEILIPILHDGDRRKIAGQAAVAIVGHGSLAGWNFCPKPEPSAPL